MNNNLLSLQPALEWNTPRIQRKPLFENRTGLKEDIRREVLLASSSDAAFERHDICLLSRTDGSDHAMICYAFMISI